MNFFEQFWAVYPRKVGKGKARQIMARIKPDATLQAKMIKAIEIQAQSVQWQKDNGQYIPHPTTWLNQERWEDEPIIFTMPKQARCYCGKPAILRVGNRSYCSREHRISELGW